jgi:hypothetical protein
MQFASVQEPSRDVSGLKGGSLGRRMSRQVAANPYQDVPAPVGIGPFPELAYPGLQHLIGMKACILPQQHMRKRCYQVIRRVPQGKMPCHEAADSIDLPLPVKGIEQGRADTRDGLGEVVQSRITVVRQPCWRNIQVTGQIDRHRAMENAPSCLGRIVRQRAARRNPLQGLVNGITVGENVMRSLPVGVLVGCPELCHPARRRIRQGARQIHRRGSSPDGRFEGL